MAERVVRCSRLGTELPGLEKPPFPGALGTRIFENVSQQAWDAWQAESDKLIRDKGFSMADPQARREIFKAMEEYFFGADSAEGIARARAAVPAGTRMVTCAKLSRELPGLLKPPFPGKLGQRIFDEVSAQAWEMWEGQSVILMNHYGLSMADPEARAFVLEQMEEFFFGAGAKMPADWVPPVPGGGGGKGGGGKGGGKGGGGGGKGAPGARRK